jgi:RNA polymerase sigma-70 factor (ECF subfamily)
VQALRKERGNLDREKWFLAVHDASHDRINRYFRRRTEHAATAEDLSAKVFRIAWEKSGQSGDLSVMVLFRVARNVLHNHEQSTYRSANLLAALQQEWRSEHQSHRSPLREALEQLRPDDREMLLLSYWDGFTSAEIADLFNLDAAAVRMQLHRARRAVSDLIQISDDLERQLLSIDPSRSLARLPLRRPALHRPSGR